jgi:hypothetical protein
MMLKPRDNVDSGCCHLRNVRPQAVVVSGRCCQRILEFLNLPPQDDMVSFLMVSWSCGSRMLWSHDVLV